MIVLYVLDLGLIIRDHLRRVGATLGRLAVLAPQEIRCGHDAARLGHRPLRDLRVSVTDRCTYGMPKEVFGRDFQFLPRSALLTFDEIARLARRAVAQGVQKIRLTGGEPLVRRDLEQLVALLAPIDGLADLTLTTNGALLTPTKAPALKDAGLQRITISLDALDDAIFMAMNDVGFPVAKVLAAIEAAVAAGLAPVKINMVVKRGVNEGSILAMARYFRGSGHILRLIEYMDVGTTNGWRMEDVVPAAAIVARINAAWPLGAHPSNPRTRARSPPAGGMWTAAERSA